jgi:signal transduction histidine kinase
MTFEDLQVRIVNCIEDAEKASDANEFSFRIDSSAIQRHIFTSVEGMNLYRIIQEAVNNALKYASATEITVDILEDEDEYHINIEDNGKGFDKKSVEMGNGFDNMKKRAKEIGGRLTISSLLNKGTSIRLILPTTELSK